MTTPSEHFNGLTPAEAERLAMLAEEAAEVAQAAMKILRHGYESFHPDAPAATNRTLLEAELTDLRAVQDLMHANGDIRVTDRHEVLAALHKKHRYTHHQRGPSALPHPLMRRVLTGYDDTGMPEFLDVPVMGD